MEVIAVSKAAIAVSAFAALVKSPGVAKYVFASTVVTVKVSPLLAPIWKDKAPASAPKIFLPLKSSKVACDND